MANTQTAKTVESPAEQLARVMAENAAYKAQIAAKDAAEKAAAGEFKLGVTVAREPGTKGPKDMGSNGGSLRIGLGKQSIFPSKLMVEAIFEHEAEIKAYVKANDALLVR